MELFKKDGYLVLKDFFSLEEEALIKKTGNELFNLPEIKNSYMKYYENTSNGRILSRMEYFLNNSGDFKELINNKVQLKLEEIVGERMCLFKDKINWKLPNGGQFKPHQDQEAWSDFPPKYYVSCAIGLDDCYVENGCLEMVKGKHKEGIHRNTNGTIDADVVSEMIWEYIYSTPRDLLIFDSFVPHRSDINKTTNPRRVFYFTYNKNSEGNYYEQYFAKKRRELPPDIERESGKIYDFNSKYNLANPIS